jgi:hypothetical protein
VKCGRCDFNGSEGSLCPRCGAEVRASAGTIQLTKLNTPAHADRTTADASWLATPEPYEADRAFVPPTGRAGFPKKTLIVAGAAGVVLAAAVGIALIWSSGSGTPKQTAIVAPLAAASASSAPTSPAPTEAASATPTGSAETSAAAANPPTSSVPSLDASGNAIAALIAPVGVSSVHPMSGPSGATDSAGNWSVYAPTSNVVDVGQRVAILCTTWGHREDMGPLGSGRLWDYTQFGWISDQLMNTHSPDPVANACAGSISNPMASSTPPDPSTGPFPIYDPGSATSVYSAASISSDTVGSVQDGDFVTLSCQQTGDKVSGPDDLTGNSVGQSSAWDHITAPVDGWVPDAFVNSATEGSAAPSC